MQFRSSSKKNAAVMLNPGSEADTHKETQNTDVSG